MAIPHWPGALWAAEAYHSDTRELSHCWSPCALAAAGARSKSSNEVVRWRELVERVTGFLMAELSPIESSGCCGWWPKLYRSNSHCRVVNLPVIPHPRSRASADGKQQIPG